jgi:hypothetical protein
MRFIVCQGFIHVSCIYGRQAGIDVPVGVLDRYCTTKGTKDTKQWGSADLSGLLIVLRAAAFSKRPSVVGADPRVRLYRGEYISPDRAHRNLTAPAQESIIS